MRDINLAIQFLNPIFEEADMAVIREIAEVGDFRSFETDEYLVKQGDIGDCAFLILAGNASVETSAYGETAVLGDLNPGDLFGEIALIYDTPRSCSVKAKSKVVALCLSRTSFQKTVIKDAGALHSMVKTLTRRVQELTDSAAKLAIVKKALHCCDIDSEVLKKIKEEA